MHRQFLRIISQNPQNVKIYCNDLKNPFLFVCRRWMINLYSDIGETDYSPKDDMV